jgi:predicted Zn-dependent protease
METAFNTYKKIFIMKRKILLCLLAFCFGVAASYAQTAQQDELLKILINEIDRGMTFYQKADIPVYLISYRVDEVESYNISTSFGTLTASTPSKERVLTVQVRVGDKTLDNFHELRDDASQWVNSRYTKINIPVDNNPKAIALALWEATETEYRNAAARYEKVKANVAVKVEAEDKSPDYSENTPVQYYEKPQIISDFKFDAKDWENRLKSYSAQFADNKEILEGGSTLRFSIERKYFVTNEGTSIAQNNTYCHVYLSVKAQADDGMELPLYQIYFAHSPQNLPDNTTMMNDAQHIAKTVVEMKSAPVVDPYTGPAILSNDAAGVFFHEIFGHRVEGLRLKSETDGQTFKKKVNEVVLPKDLSVIFDPTIALYNGIPLNGSFKYDDEGQKGEKVIVVDKGVLKNFLMTRTPINNFPKSNGHARAQAGFQPVSRQSNLIVETEKPYTDAQLKAMLIEEAKKQEKEYGYLFAKVTGGFTMTGRFIPNSFNVIPLEVYRVFVDGRPDELVRGVDLVGTPLAMFSQVEAAGDTPGNFAGTCGAESGGVPAGCCSPALFVKQIEMQKKDKSQNRPPILERP